jgi:hypothetical protein
VSLLVIAKLKHKENKRTYLFDYDPSFLDAFYFLLNAKQWKVWWTEEQIQALLSSVLDACKLCGSDSSRFAIQKITPGSH